MDECHFGLHPSREAPHAREVARLEFQLTGRAPPARLSAKFGRTFLSSSNTFPLRGRRRRGRLGSTELLARTFQRIGKCSADQPLKLLAVEPLQISANGLSLIYRLLMTRAFFQRGQLIEKCIQLISARYRGTFCIWITLAGRFCHFK